MRMVYTNRCQSIHTTIEVYDFFSKQSSKTISNILTQVASYPENPRIPKILIQTKASHKIRVIYDLDQLHHILQSCNLSHMALPNNHSSNFDLINLIFILYNSTKIYNECFAIGTRLASWTTCRTRVNMQNRYTLNKEQSFVLRPEDLTKIIDTLQNSKLNLDYITAYCNDDVNRHFDSLCEFLRYANAKGKEINSLHIHFGSTERDRSVLILFLSQRLFSVINVTISAPNHIYYTLRDEMDDIFSGIRPLYHFFAHATYAVLVNFFLFLIYFGLIVLWFDGFIKSDFVKTLFNVENSEFIRLIGYIISLGLTGLVSYCSFRVYHYLFPKGVFAIGQGASRYKSQQEILKWVVYAFIPLLLTAFIKLVFF